MIAEYLEHIADLEARYDAVVPTAVTKEVTELTRAHQWFIEVRVDRAYSQCPEALTRSKLWDPASLRTTDDVPTVGQMMEQTDSEFDAAAYDTAYPEPLRTTMY